jgi:methylmalonyl-CoA/ethylmalonyl-CoA epimerase
MSAMADGLVLDHVGYVVPDIRAYLDQFVLPVLRPAAIGPIVEDPIQQVRIAFVTLADGNRIELIEPASVSSPVRSLLNKGRGGLYHVCYGTARMQEVVDRFVAQGSIVVTGPVPAAAMGGRRIIFLFTPSDDLIELVETSSQPEGAKGESR